MSSGSAVRTLAIRCPDWPVAAAVPAGLADAVAPVAVVRANRVIASGARPRRRP
ncbi:hypothetical protein Acy02nite_89730 [Actinoplanes cyaneus]|uniref:Uncharacterized protein n=1 Tax=Actinoplanes cyaneus TaxID=52696 RepID=A0A919M9Q1_9ACTN|nr:hypothetical protein [Actinoplanes cyaneus]GID71092.1 hypothetical protein Acy02nite_89730 [Actinoplanes cyaneus]